MGLVGIDSGIRSTINFVVTCRHGQFWVPIGIFSGRSTKGLGDMANAKRKPITRGSLGAEPPVGSRGRTPGQAGGKRGPSEAERFDAFICLKEGPEQYLDSLTDLFTP